MITARSYIAKRLKLNVAQEDTIRFILLPGKRTPRIEVLGNNYKIPKSLKLLKIPPHLMPKKDLRGSHIEINGDYYFATTEESNQYLAATGVLQRIVKDGSAYKKIK